MGSVGRVVEREIQLSTEQIIMIRQSLVLATVITLSTSQSAHSHQYQINDGGRRRFARRVITGMEPSDRNVLGRDDRSSRREFSPIFDFNSPYLMIDSEKFTVLPAVPNPINQRSQKSLSSNNNQNFLFPSTSNLKPIPAVPPRKTTTKKPRECKTRPFLPRFLYLLLLLHLLPHLHLHQVGRGPGERSGRSLRSVTVVVSRSSVYRWEIRQNTRLVRIVVEISVVYEWIIITNNIHSDRRQ